MGISFQHDLQTIDESMKKQRITPSHLMGGNRGIAPTMVITKNLCNSSHVDNDNSKTMIVQLEQIDEMAKGWCFVLPNTTIKGNKKAIVIKNFHGLVMSVDARNIFHCTSLEDKGIGNDVFGLGYYSKKYN